MEVLPNVDQKVSSEVNDSAKPSEEPKSASVESKPVESASSLVKKSAVKPSASVPPAGPKKLAVTSTGAVKIVGSQNAPAKLTGAPSTPGAKITAGASSAAPVDGPTGYKSIDRNVYVSRPEVKLRPHELPRCHCKEGENCSPATCENAMVFIECSPERCHRGKACKNQRFQKRQYAGVIPKRSGAKGWGIYAQLPVSAGQFVLEYVGEVIDADELDVRSRECEKEPHFYFLSISAGDTIDASKKGNISRFINHSCDPNCVTQKWQVNGESRVGIFALRNIRVGEELTFDYQFERFSHKKQRCLCGASNCSKWLGSKPKPKDGSKPIKKEREEIRYKEISEAILPDEHVALLLEDQNIDAFPFTPTNENWYFMRKEDILLESDTEESESESESESDSESDTEPSTAHASAESSSAPGLKASKNDEGAPPAKSAKRAEHDTPHGEVKKPHSHYAHNGDADEDEPRPQHPARQFVNKIPKGSALFRRTSASNQKLVLLDTYSEMLYDKIDSQKEKKTMMQDAELAAMSTLVGADVSQIDWMASLDLKQLMKDGLLEFEPRSDADRAQRRRASTRSAKRS